MAWVGYNGPNRVVTKFGKTFWRTNGDDAYLVEVTVESEIDWFKKDQNFEVRESLVQKAKRAVKKAAETASAKSSKPSKTSKRQSRASTSTNATAVPRSRREPSRPSP